MFEFMRTPENQDQGSKPSLGDEGSSACRNPFDSYSGPRDSIGCNYNPFDSDTELDTVSSKKKTPVTGRGMVFKNVVLAPDFGTPDKKIGDFEREVDMCKGSVQGVENQVVTKAEETTSTVKKCLKIAEEIRVDAVRTLEMLHRQGQQITRTHHVAVDIDRDLSRGEKFLGSLGNIFSITWKPKKTRDIAGPLTMTAADDNMSYSDQHSEEQRENLVVVGIPKTRSASTAQSPDTANAFQKKQVEKGRQDDGLSDLSYILGDLKDMALEMGLEIERQNKALDHFSEDVDELNFRVKGANQRTIRLLGK